MAEKIFLEKNRNIKALNKENEVNVNLTQKARLLPFEGISDKLNLAELFDTERDNCDKYRLIFDVNTMCSNILYNMKTEIVKDEGSPYCKVLLGEQTFENSGYTTIGRNNLSTYITGRIDPVDYMQAIRDTEYSHTDAGNLVYHCGLDIFNNHMLKSKSFAHINKVSQNSSTEVYASGPVFNTIFDFQRDDSGKRIQEELPNNNYTGKVYTHVYRVDGVMSFEEAYNKRFTHKDGWYGFNNVGYIEIPNGKTNGSGAKISVNRLMNNNKACEFIDMYPDRSLYSFVPKKNKYWNRAERNWDYCITYPYEADYGKLNTIMAIETGGLQRPSLRTCPNTIRALVITGKTANGHDLHLFKTVIKHNLNYGDTIKLFVYDNDELVEQKIVISGIGDVDGSDTEHCFRIYTNELNEAFRNITDGYVWMRRLANGSGCKYYFRKFKKVLTDEGETPNSSIGKLGFSENIYGDRVAEVIYTDDINVDGLKDNLGRPLSELYFTVVKANRGYKLWYEQNNFTDQRIEFSHCFGKVTSGINTISEEVDYNVNKLHNIEFTGITSSGETTNLPYTAIPGRKYREGYRYIANRLPMPYSRIRGVHIPTPLETDITENGKDWFYGDIVEFDPSTNVETVLEVVYHRFNTAQREITTNPCYYDIRNDILIADDYDIGIRINGTQRNKFTVLSDESGRTFGTTTAQSDAATETDAYSTYLNTVLSGDTTVFFPGNLQPEGYYYQAHYPIKIRQISDAVNTETGAVLNYVGVNSYSNSAEFKPRKIGKSKAPSSATKTIYFIEIATADDYGYIVGDLFGVYDIENEKLYWAVIDTISKTENYDDNTILLTLEVSGEIPLSKLTPEATEIILTDGALPTYASYIKEEQKFVWREVLKPSQVSGDNELSDMMFTNGRNYIHTNIDLYLKRQDPFGVNGLLFPGKNNDTNVDADTSELHKFKPVGYEINYSQLEYIALEMQNDCL